MNTIAENAPVEGAVQSVAQSKTPYRYKRYANILCFLRDDIQREKQDTDLPCDNTIHKLVAEGFEAHFSELEWEEVVVKLLLGFAKTHEPSAQTFSSDALSRIKSFRNNSYIWLH